MGTTSKELTVSPYLVFFLIHSLQVGIGILGYQRIIIKSAGYDAWISLILAGIATHFVLFCMLKMLEKDNDLINIHTTCFGKWIGSLFFTNRESINALNTLLSQTGMYIVYIYIPLLFLWHSIRWRLKNKRNQTSP
ncbi:spore germination protein [Bacillus bingmayongensis]|nr:spore germination protein [Bacillus bingmayongensis]